jgi:hypothetical protein
MPGNGVRPAHTVWHGIAWDIERLYTGRAARSLLLENPMLHRLAIVVLVLGAAGVAEAKVTVHDHTHGSTSHASPPGHGSRPPSGGGGHGTVIIYNPAPRPVYVYRPYHVGYYYRPGYYATSSQVGYAPWTWYAGAGVLGTRVLSQSGGSEELGAGAGVSLWGGIRFNRRFGVELGWLGSFHNPTSTGTDQANYLALEGLTADARIHLNGSGNWDPYITGGLGLYFMGREGLGPDAVGSGFQAGAGMDYWLGDFVTLGLRARFHGISMQPSESQPPTATSTFITAATVEGSIALHF